MVGAQIISDFAAAQGVLDIPITVAIGVIIGLPLYIAAYLILSAGFSESENDTSNWRHRALSFYDETIVGKILMLLCLFAPTIGVFITNILVNPNECAQAGVFAMMPWGMACPFIPLDKLSAARLQPQELNEDPESGTLPQELE